MISASRLRRIRRCAASGALPQVDTSSEAATTGTAVHRFLEDCSKRGRELALADVPDEAADVCAAIDLDALPVHLAHEVAYAYDVTTGAVRRTRRGYPDLGATEIGVTVDVEGVRDDAVFVADYKTGFRQVAKPGENEQILLGALCSSRYHGKDAAHVEVIYVREGRKPWREVAALDVFDLAAFVSVLRRIWDRYQEARAIVAAGRVPNVSEGEHCRYCPALNSCPAKAQLLRRMVDGELSTEIELTKGRPTARHYFIWQQMKQITDRVGAIIHAAAADEPIDLGDGRMFGKVERQGSEVIDGDKAYQAARDLHGQEYADAAVERKATKAGLRKALKPYTSNVAKSERELLAEIRRRDGITRRAPSSKFEEFPARLRDDNEAA